MSEQTYTVEEIRDTRHWEGKYGPMISYDLSLQGVDAKVELAQKPTTAAPTVGQQLFGTIEDGQFGKKFRKAQQQASFNGGGKKDDAYKADPLKLRAENMRSAIHAASDYVSSMAAAGRVPEGFTNYKSMDPIILHFYSLIEGAMKDAADEGEQQLQAALARSEQGA